MSIWTAALEYLDRPAARWGALAGLGLGAVVLVHGSELYTLAILLPIILISGHTGPMLTQMALGAGVREVLKKPVQSRELAAALARALAA